MPTFVAWNVNNRVGLTRFRPEAAQAAMALDADVIVFNEFYPGPNGAAFTSELSDAGWPHQHSSPTPKVKANRVLFASRIRFDPLPLPPTTVDEHLTSNAAAIVMPNGLVVVGMRVPTYKGALLTRAWDWIENLANDLSGATSARAVIVGDLNTSMLAQGARRMPQFHRMLDRGWRREQPAGIGSFMHKSGTWHEIDHILSFGSCAVSDTHYVRNVADLSLAGTPDSVSDHAALTFRVTTANAKTSS